VSSNRNLKWVIHRLLSAVPIIFFVSLVTFFLLDNLPGSAARQLLGLDASQEQVEALEKDLGLDVPVTKRYIHWISEAFVGDLGRSLASGQEVSALLQERFPVTLQLVLLTLVLSLLIALPSALIAARYPDHAIDRLVMMFSMVCLSTPSYVLALLLVFVFSVRLGMLPAIGYIPPDVSVLMTLRTLLLPAFAIALPQAGMYARMLRADILEKLAREEYIAMAIANGSGPWRVILRHALRNSASGFVTLATLNLGLLIAGTVIIEQVFALPGLGRLFMQAVTTRDAPVVQGIVLLLSMSVVLATILSDILCRFIDPRVAHGYHAD
jgi:peptide/nickel transport system permease protein